jgi:tetratricopeptide (TPR) repeat protein
MIRPFALIMSVALLASCGSPPPRLPLALEQAQTADQDARRALRMGEVSHARILFARSLALHQSVDDVDGAASAMVSLATLSHRLHDDAAAIKLLDQMLLDHAQVYPPEWRITAAFRKAVILADQGRSDEAATVLALADRQCERNCASRFGIDVLKARMALLNGDAAAALELADPAASAREAGKEERANALRIVAAAEEKLARYDAALLHYRVALELDKSLALSGRIEEDLNGMARVLIRLGRGEEAASHARRAFIVHEAARGNAPATISSAP